MITRIDLFDILDRHIDRLAKHGERACDVAANMRAADIAFFYREQYIDRDRFVVAYHPDDGRLVWSYR